MRKQAVEPRILLIGRQQSTLDVLAEELRRYGREVLGSNDRAIIEKSLRDGAIDFVVIGGGLDDPSREAMAEFVKTIHPTIPVHLLPRTPTASPASVIPFVNDLAVLFKVHAASLDTTPKLI